MNDATVAKYIREQEMHDIAMDKMSVKEYANPFSEAEQQAYKQEKRISKNEALCELAVKFYSRRENHAF